MSAAPTPSAAPPTFVPRALAAAERLATGIGRRVAAPVRLVAARALRFVDRLAAAWGGVGASQAPRASAAPRARARMVMARPWYELDEDEADLDAAPLRRLSARAERGAAIARTPLLAPDEPPAAAAVHNRRSELPTIDRARPSFEVLDRDAATRAVGAGSAESEARSVATRTSAQPIQAPHARSLLAPSPH